jgi:Icc-related predicted phosphoesterase
MTKILRVYVIADIHSPDSFSMPELHPDDYDVLFTLGDIAPQTMDYILFMGRALPMYGILGNHDPAEIPGLNNIHGKVVEFQGVKIGGFGGGPKYKDEPNQYEEKYVRAKVKKIPPVDIFISHAPPLFTSQDEDRVHRGFEAFDWYITKHRPKVWLHAHVERKSRTRVGDTEIISVIGRLPLKLEIS